MNVHARAEHDLAQVVAAVDGIGLSARPMQHGEQDCRKNRNDRDYNEQFNERKSCFNSAHKQADRFFEFKAT
ncbi:MAG TPA: hypothetical protein VG146_04185 [Verrucomicrobiae bacterium]|nr:hypothetical protein [Verrucomicrobiae bacterium]